MPTQALHVETAASEAGVARLFIALWPPPALAAALLAQGQAVCGAGPAAGRGEAASRLHLTLLFLGSVPRTRLVELQAALCLPFVPFDLSLGQCTRWPSGVVVVEPEVMPVPLQALHDALTQAASVLGLRCEARPFKPHVTLARRHTGPWPATPAPAARQRWRVRRYHLVESPPGPPARYRWLQTCMALPAGGRAGPAKVPAAANFLQSKTP